MLSRHGWSRPTPTGGGTTIRDEFIRSAMQGLCSNPNIINQRNTLTDEQAAFMTRRIAILSRMIADAQLSEMEGRNVL